MSTDLDDRLREYAARWNVALTESATPPAVVSDADPWTLRERPPTPARRRTRLLVAAAAAVVLVAAGIGAWSVLDRGTARPAPAAVLPGAVETVPTATPRGELIPVTQRIPAPALGGPLVDGSGQYALPGDGRVVVAFSFGTWCAPCRAQATAFAADRESWSARGADVVAFATSESSVAQAATYALSRHLRYPVVWDPTGSLSDVLVGGSGVGAPMTVLVDRHGDVAAVYVGIVEPADVTAALAALAAER